MTNQYIRPGSATIPIAVNDVVLITTPEGTLEFSGGIGGAALDTTDDLTEGTTNKYFTIGRVSYEHTQGATSASWVITHNLGFKPNVTVVDSAGNIVEGEIAYTNSNSLTVSFSSAFSGKAYIS